jgi:hypothetical protein
VRWPGVVCGLKLAPANVHDLHPARSLHNAKKVWARDAWDLRSRFSRKILSHTVAVLLCRRADLGPLRFSELLTG